MDFVFIDGHQEYPAVCADLDAWLPLVKPGGVIAGDDFIAEWPGVQRAVRERFGDAIKVYGPCWVHRGG